MAKSQLIAHSDKNTAYEVSRNKALLLTKKRQYEPADETGISHTCCVECKSGHHLNLTSLNLL